MRLDGERRLSRFLPTKKLQSRLYQIIICSVFTLSFPSCGARFALTNMLASRSDESHADSLEISRFRCWRDGIAQGHLPRLYFVGPSTILSLTALYRFFYHLSLNGIRHSLFFPPFFELFVLTFCLSTIILETTNRNSHSPQRRYNGKTRQYCNTSRCSNTRWWHLHAGCIKDWVRCHRCPQ